MSEDGADITGKDTPPERRTGRAGPRGGLEPGLRTPELRYRRGMPPDRELRLGVPSMDAEHALQIGLVEALGRAVAERKSGEVANEILEKLLDYTRVHFLAEELMMRMEGYPAYEAHLAEHGELLLELQRIRAAHERGDHPVTHNAVEGLRSWLSGHVRTQDLAFAAFLSARTAARNAP